MDDPLVLIVDDQADSADLMEQRLALAGYRTEVAYDGLQGLERVKALQPDLLVLDMMMPGLNGIEVIERLRSSIEYRDLPIIVLSAKGEVEDRVAGLDAGADEYLTKPTDEVELLARVKAMLRMSAALRSKALLEEENRTLRQEVTRRQGFEELVGGSQRMQVVYGLIEKVAAAPTSVLITGESGTGKELVARAIHRQSPRAEGPFVAVDCGALPDALLEAELFGHIQGSFTGADSDRMGRLEAASGGTLFLDELASTSLPTQARLLRVLQEGEVTRIGENEPRRVDGRIVAATNRDLQIEVQEGRFREDLYFRLHVITIDLPSLRQRPEDILVLAEHFLAHYCGIMERDVPALPPEIRRLLMDYAWPGNVRELENEMERVAVLSERGQSVQKDSLSPAVRDAEQVPAWQQQEEGSLKERMGRIERRLLSEALEENGWNQTHTAGKLGITRQGLIKKMRQYGIDGRRGR